MSLEDIVKIGGAIIVSLGGASAIVIGASSFLTKTWLNLILEKEKGRMQKEIELIKSNNQLYLDSVSSSSLVYLNYQRAIITERAESIKIFWSSFLSLKKLQPTIIFFLDLYPFSKYHYIHTDPKMSELDESISLKNISKLVENDGAQDVRPFIDEQAFMYFRMYRAFIGRLSGYVQDIRNNGQPEYPWQKTKSVIEVLEQVLDEETTNAIKNEMWSVLRVLEHIELLLVEHLRELVSGKTESTHSVKHLADLSKKTSLFRQANPTE